MYEPRCFVAVIASCAHGKAALGCDPSQIFICALHEIYARGACLFDCFELVHEAFRGVMYGKCKAVAIAPRPAANFQACMRGGLFSSLCHEATLACRRRCLAPRWATDEPNH